MNDPYQQPYNAPQQVPHTGYGQGFAPQPPARIVSDQDRERLVRAGKGARAMSIFGIVRAGLMLINGRILGAIAHGAAGAFGLGGGQYLTQLAEPRTNDIDSLMKAYDNFSNMFLTRIIWVAFWAVIAFICGFVMFAVVGVAGTAELMEEMAEEFD